MQVNLSTRHGNLAEETQQKIIQKLQKLQRFHDRISTIDATIDLDHSTSPDIEVVVSVDKSQRFVARTTANNGNLIGAVESASHKLEEQLKRHKRKRIDSHRVQASRDDTSELD